jgi:hypothetical protein
MPAIGIRETANIARDYSEWSKTTTRRRGETVDTLDQKVD